MGRNWNRRAGHGSDNTSLEASGEALLELPPKLQQEVSAEAPNPIEN